MMQRRSSTSPETQDRKNANVERKFSSYSELLLGEKGERGEKGEETLAPVRVVLLFGEEGTTAAPAAAEESDDAGETENAEDPEE